MKVTTRIQYGLRFMANLAEADSKDYMQLSRIVAKEKVSIKYLENIVGLFRRSGGLIEMRRGVKGGYRLAKPASQISLYEIVKALEGGKLIEYKPNTPTDPDILGNKVLNGFVKNYEQNLKNILSETTLQDLITFKK